LTPVAGVYAQEMSRRRRLSLLALVTATVGIAGCGGSAHSSSTSATGSGGAAGAGNPAKAVGGATTSVSGVIGGPTTAASVSSTQTHSVAPAGASTNVRVPATFTIGAGGAVTPPSVSSPAFLAVQLTVISGDGSAHKVVLETPTSHSLSVPAHGRASLLIPGQRSGHYVLMVDGASRGALLIGGQPGP
jgi:hypothetical protein